MLKREMPPVHPGLILKDTCLEPLGLTVTQAVEGLGVARSTLSAIINQRAGISPEMAVKLSAAFGTTVGIWGRMQASYDTWSAEKTVSREGVTRFHPPQTSV